MTSTPLLRWLGSSVADTTGRLFIQVGSTAIFGHLLAPRDFGIAALCIALIGIAGAVLATPFEEALSQRRRVRSAHFGATLALSLSLALLLMGLIGLAGAVEAIRNQPLYLPMLGISTLLLAEGPATAYTALARRQRRFNLIAWSNLASLAIGTLCGVIMAYAGAGLWSLLAVRVLARFCTLAILMYGIEVRPRLSLSMAHLRDLMHFTRWLMASRVIDTISEATVQSLITHYFGLTANGYLNMAMRVVEPLRGAAGAIGHNLSASFFYRLQHSPHALGDSVRTTVCLSAWILQPMFLGLAVIAPTTILLISGQGWEPAYMLAILLAITAAISTLSNFIHGGLVARNRNDLGLVSSMLDLALVCVLLIGLKDIGLISLGIARVVTAICDFGFVCWVGRWVLKLDVPAMLRVIGRATFTAGLMALAVHILTRFVAVQLTGIWLLCLQILSGVTCYVLLMLLLNRRDLLSLMAPLRQGTAKATPLN